MATPSIYGYCPLSACSAGRAILIQATARGQKRGLCLWSPGASFAERWLTLRSGPAICRERLSPTAVSGLFKRGRHCAISSSAAVSPSRPISGTFCLSSGAVSGCRRQPVTSSDNGSHGCTSGGNRSRCPHGREVCVSPTAVIVRGGAAHLYRKVSSKKRNCESHGPAVSQATAAAARAPNLSAPSPASTRRRSPKDCQPALSGKRKGSYGEVSAARQKILAHPTARSTTPDA